MKAKVSWMRTEILQLTAYEKGDEPADAVDLPPALINEWQKAKLDRIGTEVEIVEYLRATNQEFER